MTERIVAGLLVSALICLAGYRLQALTATGALAALFVGTAVIGGAAWTGAAMLGTFFILSSALSRAGAATTEAEKSSHRDERQVLANGGVAALAALSAPWLDNLTVVALVGGALAAANADTWATEIGSRSGQTPRLLLSRSAVPVGVSGGVTRPGTLSSIAGALCLGIVAGVAGAIDAGIGRALMLGSIVTLAGIIGSLADSLLGETVQQRRYCDVCAIETEAQVHRCGARTRHSRGWSWVNNDIVNGACTAIGLVVAALLYVVAA